MIANTTTQLVLPLEEDVPADGRTQINGSVWFVDHDGYRVVFRWHEPLYRVALSDTVHLRLVAVSLRQSQLATQAEIARAFDHSVGTQARWERRYQQAGIDGLMPKRSPGRSRRLSKGQEALVGKWFGAEVSNLEMARRLGVGETTVRRTLKRLGLRRTPTAAQRCLPVVDQDGEQPAVDEEPLAEDQGAAQQAEPQCERPVEASPEPPCDGLLLPGSFSIDRDPHDRSGDRAMARLGLLEDALPLFADAESVPRAGALLAVPLLVHHGLIEAFLNVYGSLHPSFYGLRTMVVTLFLAALLRIKRPEHFKEYGPEDLGAILGLDRAPEVKTVRRKFTRLAAMGRGKQLMEESARRRIAEDEDRVAFLYVDGHVREYHGKFPLFQAKKAQRQVVTPAATDNWVHDADGEPLLVVTSEVNANLTQVLEPILADVRRLVGDGRRMTVIFDRGGFSPKLFARLIDAGFDVITYRKGKVKKLASTRFAAVKEKIDGVWREYTDLRPPTGSRRDAACREEVAAAKAGQGEEAVSLDAGSPRVARRRTPDADPHQPPGSVRRDGGLPHLLPLASRELLQVHGRGVCLGRPGRIRGGGRAGNDRLPQSPVASPHAAAERRPGRGQAARERTGKTSRSQRQRLRDRPCGDSRSRTRNSASNFIRPRPRSSNCSESARRSPRGSRPATGRC